MPARFRRSSWRYSRFDGSQEAPLVDADDVMAGLTDDLLYHGDLAAALRRLLQEGFDTRSGEHVEGLREMMQRLRERREELASQQNELANHIAETLDQVLDTERQALDRSLEDTANSLNPERLAEERTNTAEHHAALDLLPPSLSARLQELMHYEFVSPEAAEQFAGLLDEARERYAQLALDDAAAQLAASTPEDRQHLRDALDALNRMLEQRSAGEDLDPSFESFMESYGDVFPGDAQNLDELLAQLARRMAAASQLMASMTPEQRQQLADLSSQLMADMDLAWQLDRLGENLRDLVPQAGWDERLGPPGQDPLSILGASDTIAELAELDELGELGELLSQASEPGALGEVDLERASELLGPDAARSLEALAELTRQLEEAGLVARKGGRLVLTPAGLRRLGSNALAELFGRLRQDRFGNHPVATPGLGIDLDLDTKPYEFGDPFRLDVRETLRNAVNRRAGEGGGAIDLPIRLELDDFAIERTEHLSQASTVLLLDLSLSMPMRDNFLAAKKVAIALQSLIASRYPRDYLGIVGFSATAHEIRPEEFPDVSWDFAYGTNLQHALALSRKLLASKAGSKQVIVITDGEPTAHVMEDGQVFFNYPPVPETLEATLREVARCTRERIVINSFVLDQTGGLRSFVQKMTKMNRGRAFYTTPETLGDYVLVDFVEHRASSQRRHLRPGA